MKLWLTIILTLLLLPQLAGQDDPYGEPVMNKKELRKLAKEKKIADRQAAEESRRNQVAQLIQDQRFVLRADYLSNNRGTRQTVSSMLNFIVIDSASATIQLGNDYGIGSNGLGGITIDGRISKFEVSKKTTKRGTNYNIQIFMKSAIGNYDVNFWISPSGHTDATIRGIYSGSLTYSGQIISISEAKIYKGSAF